MQNYPNYINKPTTNLDLSKDFIIIDLSDVPEIIQDAMNVMVTGMIGSRFSTDAEKETIIAVDEAAVYLRNPELSLSMLKTLTQGRSHRVFLWLATHQPSDFAKNKVKEEYKTNMFINIVLGANLENAIDDVKDYFNLTDEECETLSNAEVGQGLLIVKGQRIPVFFESTPLEMSVIKGTYNKKNTPTASEFTVFIELQWIVNEQKIIFADWGIGNSNVLKDQGFDKHMVTNLIGAGRIPCFVPKGMIDSKEHVYPEPARLQTLDHLATVLQGAALLQHSGYEEIQIIHDEGLDFEGTLNGEKFGFDYLRYNKKDPGEYTKKLESALEKYDHVKFICSATDYTIFSKGGIGEKYLLKRGEDTLKYITNPFNTPIQDFQVI
jgi:hypothetical protein